MAANSSVPLDPDEIMANLPTKQIGKKVIVYKSTASTNNIAAEHASDPNNNGLAIFTEFQAAGRGRLGNTWQSNPAESILCSVLLCDCKCPAELLTLAAAVAAAEAIGKCGTSDAKIKWPNDIMINGKKIAGILLESKIENGRTCFILGIGINCHQKQSDFPADLRKTATSIDIETSNRCDRTALARRLLVSIEHWLDLAGCDSQAVTDSWQRLSTLLGHRITVQCDQRRFVGNCIGVDPAEGLILQLDVGMVRMFHAAHTAIIKQ